MADFTLKTYKSLLLVLKENQYEFQPFMDYLKSPAEWCVILRHDVDRLPQNALKLAQLESSLCIKGTYYFRVVPESYDLDIIHKIASLGHEIGYHYEDIDLAFKRQKLKVKRNKLDDLELIDMAYHIFCENLEMLRKHFDIKTICMHGSPRSKYDNKLIWSKYDYQELGILGEPYFYIDFDEVVYFTDTGRRWNGKKVSVRDKVPSKFNFDFKSTQEIIEHINELPNKIMFNFHPHRWFDFGILWLRELFLQNIKNVIKYYIIHR